MYIFKINTNQEKIFIALIKADRPLNVKEIAEATNLRIRPIYYALHQLRRRGLIPSKSYAENYTLTAKGRKCDYYIHCINRMNEQSQ